MYNFTAGKRGRRVLEMKKPQNFKYINKNRFKKFKYINRVFKVEKVYVRDHSSLSKTDTYYL